MKPFLPYWKPVTDLEEFLDPKRVKYFKWESPDRTILTQRGRSIPDSFIYPNVASNKVFYYSLTSEKKYQNLYNPLEFFNILYNCLEIILANIDERECLKSWFRSRDMEPDSNRYQYLMKSLFYLICELNRTPWLLTDEDPSGGVVSELLEYITLDLDREIDRLGLELEWDKMERVRVDSQLKKAEGLDPFEGPAWSVETTQVTKGKAKKRGVTHQIVLYYIYEGIYFGESEARVEAKKNKCNHISLLNRYRSLKEENDRLAGGLGEKAFNELVDAMLSLINSGKLSETGKDKAASELITLKANRHKFRKKNIDY